MLTKYLILSSVLLFANVLGRKWEIPVEYAVESDSFRPLGVIEFIQTADGNYTGRFQSDSGVFAYSIYSQLLKSNTHAPYRVRSGQISSSNEGCLMALGGLQHLFAVTINPSAQKILSLTVFPDGIYDAAECSVESLPKEIAGKISGRVVVTSLGALPGPDVTTYLQRLEEEKRARQHGASQDNRSFLAKYWMYIVPAVVLIMITNAASGEQGQE